MSDIVQFARELEQNRVNVPEVNRLYPAPRRRAPRQPWRAGATRGIACR